NGGQAMSMHLTKDFAHALQARVSLEMHDFQGAIDAADEIIPNYPLASSQAELESLWTDDNSSEILIRLYTSLQEGRASGPSFINFSFSSQRYRPQFVPSKKVLELYDDGDYRKDVYFVEHDIY